MYLKNIDFSIYSSIKIGQIENVLVLEKEDEIPSDRYLVGGANNLLIAPSPRPLMLLGKDFAYIESKGDILEVGAATPGGKLLSFAKKHDIGGFEFMAKLPGTIGGMTAMNAGVKEHEIFGILKSVKIHDKWMDKEEIEHGYRYADLPGIVTAVRFENSEGFDDKLAKNLDNLRLSQPSQPSAGSAFKNPPGDFAGRLIESVGLKGYREGGMAWSEMHANFLVNLGNGRFDEAIKLIELAQKRVFEEYGVRLEREIIVID